MPPKGLNALNNLETTRSSMGGPTTAELKRQLSELKTTAPSKVDIDKLFTREPFVSYLPIKKHLLADTAADMKKNGFDSKQPIMVIVEFGNYYIIDGHTRFAAAKLAELKEVWIIIVDIKANMFDNDQSAMDDYLIDYMRKLQFGRRNASEYEYVLMAQRFEKDPNNPAIEREQFAAKYYLSRTKAGYIITVGKRADKLSLKMLEEEQTSVNKIYKAIQKVKQIANTRPDLVKQIQSGSKSFLDIADILDAEEKTKIETVIIDHKAPEASPVISQEKTVASLAETTSDIETSQQSTVTQEAQTQQPPVQTIPATGETPKQPPVVNDTPATTTTPPSVTDTVQQAPTAPAVPATIQTPPAEQDTSGGDLALGSLGSDENQMQAIFDEYKIYLNRQKVQTKDSVLVNFREHLIAMEKIGVLDSDTVEFLLDKVDTLED